MLLSYLGKRTQTPSSSPDPFSCYKMQRGLNEKLQVCPIFCLSRGVQASSWVQVWVQLARSFGGKIGVKRCRINESL
jgi:hypothetical protein